LTFLYWGQTNFCGFDHIRHTNNKLELLLFQGNRSGWVMNQVSRMMRGCIEKYYQGWLVCEDPGCSGRTRLLPLEFQRAYPVCSTCRKAIMYSEYSDTQLYNQIQFILHIFDIRKAQSKLDQDELTYVR